MTKKENGRATSVLHLTEQSQIRDHYSTQLSKQWMGSFPSSGVLENISAAIPLVSNSGFHCLGHSPTGPRNASGACLSARHQDPPQQSAQAHALNPCATAEEHLHWALLSYLSVTQGFVSSASLEAPHPDTQPRPLSLLFITVIPVPPPCLHPRSSAKQIFTGQHILCIC